MEMEQLESKVASPDLEKGTIVLASPDLDEVTIILATSTSKPGWSGFMFASDEPSPNWTAEVRPASVCEWFWGS
jgi:hypothetical protein